MAPAFGLAFGVSKSMSHAKGKNTQKALLDAGYNFIDNKTNTEPSSLLKGLQLILTNNEINDIIKVVKSIENRGIFLKETTGKTISQKAGLFRFLGSLMKVYLPLMTHVLTPLAKIVLIPLTLTTAASATYAAIQKKVCVSDIPTLIISNKELKYIRKIVKYLEEYSYLIKGASETIENEIKKG